MRNLLTERPRRATCVLAAAVALPWALASLPAHAGGTGGVAMNGFTAPLQLPGSYATMEPSIAVDSAGRIFVTGPQQQVAAQAPGTALVTGSPVWRSTDGGATFQDPVRANGDPRHGDDADLAIDSHDDVFQADLWLGNTAMALSTDHGQSFVANQWSTTTAGADRPWLAYSPHDNVIYDYYNGLDALYVGHTAPLVTPQAGLAIPVDLPAATDCGPVSTCTEPGLDTHCECPPGGIAVDPGSGEVYITYGSENGVVVAGSTDQGLSWTRVAIPGSAELGDGWAVTYNFQPVKVDAQGNVYVAWAQAQDASIDGNGNVLAAGGTAIRFSRSTDHGRTWSAPVTASTTTTTNVFPTLALGGPGVVHIGYYGTTATGDPGDVADTASWDVMVSTSHDALEATPQFDAEVAVQGIHDGCVNLLSSSGCSGINGNGLGDFFQMATASDGSLDIAYASGTTGTVTVLSTQFGYDSVTVPDTYVYFTSRKGG
jgi:hypothetical protein